MVKCPYCKKVFVENTLFCSECGTYLVKHEDRRTDPLDTNELVDLTDPSRFPETATEPPSQSPPRAVQLKIGPYKRVIEASVLRPIHLGRVDPSANVFPEVDVTDDSEATQTVSRRHARILWQSDTLVIEDLGSVNGTFLNGKRLDPYIPEPLHNGDTVYLGKMEIEVYILE
ncbi:MAG: FHA domain-containing protein [Chloroflexi bacterium]|nr:MAG: FHA domain-containing protein [Chloroflexota bacterium]